MNEKLEKLNRELAKGEARLRRAQHEQKILEHQMKQLNSCTFLHTTFKTEIRLSDYQTPIESATSQNHRFRRCPATGHR